MKTILGMISVLGMAVAMVSCKPDEESLRGEAGFILDTTSRWTLADPDRLGVLSGSYEVFNDTMIEGVRWRQIGRNSREGWVLDCLLRQEGEQVYRYDAASGEGLLVYDLDVAEGEQVTVYGLEGAETLTVEKVGDTVLPGGDGLPYRYVLLRTGDYRDVWVENMGSLRTGFYFFGTSTRLEGFIYDKRPGIHLYVNPEYAYLINE